MEIGYILRHMKLQDDVEEILKEGCGWDAMSPKPTARRRRVVMSNPVCAAFRCAADLTTSEMQWLDPLGRDSEGNKTFAAAFRGRGHQVPLYICRSCCVILRAAGTPDSFYIARAVKLYERSSDGAKMVSCQWFYRAEDTILANRKGSANRVGKQELFESDSVDDNSLHAIEDICEVLAEPLLDNVNSWLSSQENVVNNERYFYGSKYIPSMKCFRALGVEDLHTARLSFAASARAIEQTAALRIIGQLIRATLLPAPSSQPAFVRVSLRLRREIDGCRDVERIPLRNTVTFGSEWKRVLSSEVYGLIASRSLVTSSRVGLFEPSEPIENDVASIDQDKTTRTRNSLDGQNHSNLSVGGLGSQILSIAPSTIAEMPTRVETFAADFRQMDIDAPDLDLISNSSTENSKSCDTAQKNTIQTSQGLYDETAIKCIYKQTDDSDISVTNTECPYHANAGNESFRLSSDIGETVQHPELLSYSSPTQSSGDDSHRMLEAHPPARSKYKAPRLQIVQLPDSPDMCERSARKGRKRDEPCSSREPRRGLQIEFSGVTTLNHSISKRVRKFDSQHSSITWIGSGRRIAEGRISFSAALLATGQEISVGNCVKLIAERKAYFLARVEEMWETERDGLKMMRCQWFCRPGETLLSNHSAAISVAEHPREVFLDESGCDENFMTTIVCRTVILHKDHLPNNFDLHLLQRGDYYFFSRSYSRHTRQLSPVQARSMSKAVKEDVETLAAMQHPGAAGVAESGSERAWTVGA